MLRRGEAQHHDLTAELGKAHVVSGHALQHEVRRRHAGQLRARSRRSRRREQRANGRPRLHAQRPPDHRRHLSRIGTHVSSRLRWNGRGRRPSTARPQPRSIPSATSFPPGAATIFPRRRGVYEPGLNTFRAGRRRHA